MSEPNSDEICIHCGKDFGNHTASGWRCPTGGFRFFTQEDHDWALARILLDQLTEYTEHSQQCKIDKTHKCTCGLLSLTTQSEEWLSRNA